VTGVFSEEATEDEDGINAVDEAGVNAVVVVEESGTAVGKGFRVDSEGAVVANEEDGDAVDCGEGDDVVEME
jgi:hypothetical protein